MKSLFYISNQVFVRSGFFVGLAIIQSAFGQIQPTDSLLRELEKSRGTKKVDVLNQLTYELISRDNGRAMQFCEQALELSRNLDYKKGEGVASTYRGVYEYLSGEFSDGRTSLLNGLRLAHEAKDKRNEGYTLLQLGNSYMDQAYLDSARVRFDQAYEILRDSLDPVTLSKLYRNIAMLHSLRSEAELRDRYMQRSLAIRQATRNKYYIADALIVMASFRIKEGNENAGDSLLVLAEAILKTNPSDRENLNDLRHQRALVLLRQRKFDQALELFDSARNYYLHNSLLQKFVTLQTDVGKIFYDRGEYEMAINNLYAALRVSELKGFRVETMDVQLGIGWVEFHLGELEHSLLLADSALALAESSGMPTRIVEGLTLKGVILTESRRFDQARTCLERVRDLLRQSSDKAKISEAYLNLGYLEETMGHYAAARSWYEQCIVLADESNYHFGKAWSLLGLGNIYLQTKDPVHAQQYLDMSEQIAESIHANKILMRIYEAKRDLLASQSRYKEALSYAVKSDLLKDSLQRSDLARRFANLQKVDEIERRDRDIKLLVRDRELAQEKITLQDSKLRQQYILLIAGTVGLLLLAALAFLYARYYARIKRLNSSLTSSKTRIQNQADELLTAHKQLQQLYNTLSEQKEEMQSQSDELATSYEQIRLLNHNLEGLVAEKTRDIQLTNEELVKQNNELLQFSYTVSHNLRGPVARLLGLTDLIQHSGSPEEQANFINLVHKTSQDLDLILKDLSKIIDLRNNLNSTKERVDLEAEWLKCCDLLHDSIREQFDIQSDFSAVPEIFTVKPFIQSIFYNLLSNAIKYRSPERNLKVTASTRQVNGNTVLEIQDNGLGIDMQKHHDSVFKLFKRFHTHVEGRGLGLFLIKSQVNVLNGTIEVDSAVNRGTTFKVVLPFSAN